MTFTKEQLQNLIEFNSSDSDGQANAESWEVHKLAEMALAGMEAEPAGVTDKSEIECLKRGEMANVMPPDYKGCDSGDSVYLYDAPQPLTTSERAELENYRNAQQVVPEWTNEQCLEFLSIAFRHAEIKGDLEMDDIRLGVKMVNACRAAMLQGKADGNSPVIQDGWVTVPVEMTPEQMRAVQLKSEIGAYAVANLAGAYSLFSEFWRVAISAATKKEV